jgi:hypothetical protein
MRSYGGARAAALAVAILLAGCTAAPGGGDKAAPASGAAADAAPLVDVPPGTALPAGYHIDSARSLILGDGESWTGRLAYSATGSADEVFEFLRREMPKFGWVETYAVRSEVDLLGFASTPTGRVANFRIERGSMLDNTRVEMIVSPAPATHKPPLRSRASRQSPAQ